MLQICSAKIYELNWNMMWIFRNVVLIKTNWEQNWQLAFIPLFHTQFYFFQRVRNKKWGVRESVA